jgi:hypothetical protein
MNKKLEFPALPLCKKMTIEQAVQQKMLLSNQKLDENDIKVLEEANEYYIKAFNYLKSIDLSSISEEQELEIKQQLGYIFGATVFFVADADFENIGLFRASIVRDNFLENGKVRNTTYIKEPPLDMVKKNGFYGRLNSPNSTILYLTDIIEASLYETKPEINSRVIISNWRKKDAQPFIYQPIINKKVLINEISAAATKNFNEQNSKFHPIFKQYLEIVFEFLGEEYIKDVKSNELSAKRYEYLFSAYSAEAIFKNGSIDAIIYPSVAFGLKANNIAVCEKSATKLEPFIAEEYLVDENHNLRLIRTSVKIENNEIIWDDDK